MQELTAAANDADIDSRALADMPSQQTLLAEMNPWVEAHEYAGFAVVNKKGRIVAADHQDMIGRDDLPIPAGLIETGVCRRNGRHAAFQKRRAVAG